MPAAVITHGYSPPVLDPAKHDLDLMPLFIQILIVRAGSLSAPSGRDAGRNASGTQGITEPVGVITTVRQQRPDLGQSIYGIHKQGGSFVVTEALGTASQKLGEMVYAQAQAEAQAGESAQAEPSSAKKDDDVVDADFEEVKDDKK